MALHMAAAERLERARTEARIAGIRTDTLVADASVRFKVEATERCRRAQVELETAQADYDAARTWSRALRRAVGPVVVAPDEAMDAQEPGQAAQAWDERQEEDQRKQRQRVGDRGEVAVS
jgi:hypothetical protein